MNHYYIPLTDQPDENTFLCGYNRVRKYGTTVLPTDTIQGIALKHNCSVSEIVRINKLWSVESLHLKEIIKIPVERTPDGSTPSRDIPSSHSNRSRPSPRSNSPVPTDTQQESMKDILSRIDKTIKTTSSTVRKLERSSTIIKDVAVESRSEHFSLRNLCSDYQQI